MTTLKLGYCTDAGEVNDRHMAFYRRRARAGVGLISSEPLYAQANGRELATQLAPIIHGVALWRVELATGVVLVDAWP
jgi:2,4-dienoyl-CoA reductase-like NADH-dependent reductase (Old Yellow Enzyme family)